MGNIQKGKREVIKLYWNAPLEKFVARICGIKVDVSSLKSCEDNNF